MKSNTKVPGGWKKTLTAILATHNHLRANGEKASDDTRRKRGDVLMLGFTQLRKLGFRIEDVRGFRGRHMQALAEKWVADGVKPSVVQNRISIFRLFAVWIGKSGMIQASVHYVSDPKSVTRSSIVTCDKSWSARGIDPVAVMDHAREIEPWVAMALCLQWVFGLRMRESLVFHPWLGDLGQVVDINRGTKSGRQRTDPIIEPRQRLILDQAKAFVAGKDASIAPAALSLKKARNRFYTVLRKVGVTKKNGLTAHGLRHEFANAYFAALAGYASPVQGGPVPSDKSIERYARLETAEALGHSRERITTHYLGR